MELADNWDFYAGALAAASSLVVLLGACVLHSRSRRPGRYGLLGPALLFLGPYLGFLALSYTRPFFDITYVPSVQSNVYFDWAAAPLTFGLYLLGGLAFFAGYVSFPAFRRRYGWVSASIVAPLFEIFKSALRSRKLPYFILSILVLWGIGFAANLALFAQVRGIPLIQIGIREQEDPKLTFLAEFQPMIALLAPYVSTLRSTVPARFQSVLRPRNYAGLVMVSLIALTLLGTRNLPAKLILTLFVFWLLSQNYHRASRLPISAVNSPKHRSLLVSRRVRLGLLLTLLLFISIGVAGAFSKVEIYRMSPASLPGVVSGAPIADSIGNLYSFDAILRYSGLYGHFHGSLLYTTFLSYIPGRDELYANYIVGEVLGYPESSLQSISSTFNGPALLDFGVLGVILNSVLFGGLLGYGAEAAKSSPRNLGALALFLATLILDIHLGTYNLWTFFAVAFLVGCVEYNRIP